MPGLRPNLWKHARHQVKKADDRDWWDYLSGKKPDETPKIPAFKAEGGLERPAATDSSPPSTAGIEVHESFMDTIKMKAWNRLNGRQG